MNLSQPLNITKETIENLSNPRPLGGNRNDSKSIFDAFIEIDDNKIEKEDHPDQEYHQQQQFQPRDLYLKTILSSPIQSVSSLSSPNFPTIASDKFYGEPDPTWASKMKSILDAGCKEYPIVKQEAEIKDFDTYFPRLNAAFDYVDNEQKGDPSLKVFSIENLKPSAKEPILLEISSPSMNKSPESDSVEMPSYPLSKCTSRKYIVSSYDRFWDVYSTIPSEKRHLYEIIRRNSPCFLYFDLEFSKEFNHGKDGDLAVDSLLNLLQEDLLQQFNLVMDRKNVIDLESTSSTKFSRHLIVRSCIFYNNTEIGFYISFFIYQVHKMYEESISAENPESPCHQASHLFVKNCNGQECCVIDSAVYSNNQNFRLYMSSKAGKGRKILEVSPRNQYPYSPENEKKMFLDSLICNVHLSSCSLYYPSSPSSAIHSSEVCKCYEILSAGDSNSRLENEKTVISRQSMIELHRKYESLCATESNRSKYFPKKSPYSYRLPENSPSFQANGDKISPITNAKKYSQTINSQRPLRQWHASSPYPLLDQLISEVVYHRRGQCPGRIRNCHWEHPKYICYSIINNRWCENINREHQSNNILFVANLNKFIIYQKCFDKDCENFHGEEIPFPNSVIDEILSKDNRELDHESLS